MLTITIAMSLCHRLERLVLVCGISLFTIINMIGVCFLKK